MEWTALGLERLQSPPFDLYATIKQYLSPPYSLVAILEYYLGNCRRPAASRLIERVFQVECIRLATHVLQSSSKCKPVSGAIIALPLVVLDPQYYREH